MDKKITIIVETIENESTEVEVNIENKVKHLMEKAMKELNIDINTIDSYEILYKGTKMNLDSKIEAYVIPDNGTVLLQRIPKVG